MKIVRTDLELRMPKTDAALREAGHDVVLLPDGVDEDILAREIADADLLLMCYTPITKRVIDASTRLRGIVKYGVGIDAIDIPAAKTKGILVVNIPLYAEETVAEGAFAMLIALAKRQQPLGRQMQQEGWAWPEPTWMGSDIAEKTIGLVGLGRIGKSMARMAGAGFRANVLAYDPGVTAQEARDAGAQKVESLLDMLPQCDFVSVHCVLNDSSRGLFGKEEFAALKSSAYFINVSRGAIVDELAMRDALIGGQIAGAGLDVFSQEPLTLQDHPMSDLFNLPNVILSPHLTFYTKEAMERLEVETLERCEEIISGEPVLIKSHDARLRSQTAGVHFLD